MSALKRSVLLAVSLCSLTAAPFDETPAKPKNIFPNNGIAAVLFSADLPQGHCIINLNGDWSANYSASAALPNPNPEAHVSVGSPNERQIFVLAKKAYKAVKTDEAEQVTTTRFQVYADAYRDYRGK